MSMAAKKRIIVLVIINAVLYIGFVVFDILGAMKILVLDPSPSNEMKYATIISCLLITLFSFFAGRKIGVSFERQRAARIQSIVFAITLGADFFLLFTGYFVAGVIVFLFAHAMALYRYKPNWLLPLAIVSMVLCATALIMVSVTSKMDILFFPLLCGAYAVLIIGVLVSTFHSEQPHINTLLSRSGLILFLGCDINVFFSNILSTGTTFYAISLVLMWVFYLPAQTMLALSVVSFQNETTQGKANC